MIKAVIFDMDGVLVDTEPLHSLSIEKYLRIHGKEPVFNEQGVIHQVGSSGNESSVRILADYELEDSIEEFRKKRRKIFEEIISEKLIPLPGVLEILKNLQSNNYKIGLASNRFFDHILLIIENLSIREYFDVIVGPSEVRQPKPSPDIYLDAAKELGVEPAECLAIEDSETGVISAKVAGMKVIAVPNAFTSHQDFSKADLIIKSLKDILVPIQI